MRTLPAAAPRLVRGGLDAFRCVVWSGRETISPNHRIPHSPHVMPPLPFSLVLLSFIGKNERLVLRS